MREQKRNWRCRLGWAHLAHQFGIVGPLCVGMTDTEICKEYSFTRNSLLGKDFVENMGDLIAFC